MDTVENLMMSFEEWSGTAATHQIRVPYRINPLGAHVDHQGGAVLGRSIDLYTTILFRPMVEPLLHLRISGARWADVEERISWDQPKSYTSWARYAQAAVSAFAAQYPNQLPRGLIGLVHGSLPGAGLSSSASVVLAYLHALAHVNDIVLDQAESVELVRIVENEYLGLSNGVQDQTAIVYGRADALAHMDNLNRIVTDVPNPANDSEVSWLLAYSGFSRELLSSGFNDRVAECRQAAGLLDPNAQILCQVPQDLRGDTHLNRLPEPLGRRARHFFTEIDRVEAGCVAWEAGDWEAFGRLMNESCHSSITQYESGSQPLIDLHKIVSGQTGVYGSRFCGGGYGGCLLALVDRTAVPHLIPAIEKAYLEQYPEKEGVARAFVVSAEQSVVITEQEVMG